MDLHDPLRAAKLAGDGTRRGLIPEPFRDDRLLYIIEVILATAALPLAALIRLTPTGHGLEGEARRLRVPVEHLYGLERELPELLADVRHLGDEVRRHGDDVAPRPLRK